MTEATYTARILGCGSSGGVPRIGGEDGAGNWGDCDPSNPKNRRRRCALLVSKTTSDGTTRILIDAGPDIREQLLDARIGDVDGLIITHDHADHTHGIDDLRAVVLRRQRRLDVWTDDVTAEVLLTRFGYVFIQPEGSSYPPIMELHRHNETVEVSGEGGLVTAQAHIVQHGTQFQARGFRFGNLAYTPDVSALTDQARDQLTGLDTWIVDALRYTPHPTHANVEQALSWITELKPRRAILTNLHIDLDYKELSARLPENVSVAYDGMEIDFS